MMIEQFEAQSRVRRQPRENRILPFEDELWLGAINRAIDALENIRDSVIAFSIENGLERILDQWCDTPFLCIKCADGRESTGWGMPWPLPLWVYQKVEATNCEVGEAIGPRAGKDPMSAMSGGKITRDVIIAWGIVCAMIPIIYWERWARPVVVNHSKEELQTLHTIPHEYLDRLFNTPYDSDLPVLALGSTSFIKAVGLTAALQSWDMPRRIMLCECEDLIPEPLSYEEIYSCAISRAFQARAQYPGAREVAGIQTGMVQKRDKQVEITCVVLINEKGIPKVAWSQPFEITRWLYNRVIDNRSEPGKEVGKLDPLCLDNVPYYFSEGHLNITRWFFTEMACSVAINMHVNAHLYQEQAA
jgi:non-canonical (house-cleaning) NTP pyrophosphatase